MRARMLAVIMAFAWGGSACRTAGSSQVKEGDGDGNEQAKQLFTAASAVFQAKCASCHGSGNTIGGGRFDTTKLADLRTNGLIEPGKPDESQLFERIQARLQPSPTKGAMPPVEAKDLFPTVDFEVRPPDVAAIRAWIEAGAPVDGIAPKDTTLAKVQRIMNGKCAMCHEPGNPSKFDPADLAKTIANKVIVPGNADGSLIVQRIFATREADFKLVDGQLVNVGRMPPARAGALGGRALKDAEKQLIKDWIAQSTPESILSDFDGPGAVPPAFVPFADIVPAVFDDLRESFPVRGGDVEASRTIRYLTLSHIALADPDGLQAARNSMSFLLNSMSTSPKIVRPKPIDAKSTIFRIDLKDYGWSAADWEQLVDGYPYLVRGNADQEREVFQRTSTATPYVRADWLLNKASLSQAYYTLLKLPTTFADLETAVLGAGQIAKNQGEAARRALDPNNGKPRNVIRAGFFQGHSGVSDHNRVIERHAQQGGKGTFWQSFDFAASEGKPEKSIELTPMGPRTFVAAIGSQAPGFLPDGGEMIWNLPNGLQAYYLINAAGGRIDVGPVQIVHFPDGRPIRDGLSCMDCHQTGIIKANKDELRVHARGSDLSASDKKIMAFLYPPNEKSEEPNEADFFFDVIQKDSKPFRDAVTAASFDGAFFPNQARLAAGYERGIGAETLAAELGINANQLLTLKASVQAPLVDVIDKALAKEATRAEVEAAYKGLLQAMFKVGRSN
jgi:mono/diheme cytochrome c family protein